MVSLLPLTTCWSNNSLFASPKFSRRARVEANERDGLISTLELDGLLSLATVCRSMFAVDGRL